MVTPGKEHRAQVTAAVTQLHAFPAGASLLRAQPGHSLPHPLQVTDTVSLHHKRDLSPCSQGVRSTLCTSGFSQLLPPPSRTSSAVCNRAGETMKAQLHHSSQTSDYFHPRGLHLQLSHVCCDSGAALLSGEAGCGSEQHGCLLEEITCLCSELSFWACLLSHSSVWQGLPGVCDSRHWVQKTETYSFYKNKWLIKSGFNFVVHIFLGLSQTLESMLHTLSFWRNLARESTMRFVPFPLPYS